MCSTLFFVSACLWVSQPTQRSGLFKGKEAGRLPHLIGTIGPDVWWWWWWQACNSCESGDAVAKLAESQMCQGTQGVGFGRTQRHDSDSLVHIKAKVVHTQEEGQW